jgi:hypothetical protein
LQQTLTHNLRRIPPIVNASPLYFNVPSLPSPSRIPGFAIVFSFATVIVGS